jgi:hypothetical protein
MYCAAVSDAPQPPPPGGDERRPEIVDASLQKEGLAYAALVIGILSLVLSVICIGLPGLVLGPAAAVMGFISRRRVAASGGTLRGGDIALAGLILGIIGFGAGVAILVFAFWVVGLFQCGPPDTVHQPGLRCP